MSDKNINILYNKNIQIICLITVKKQVNYDKKINTASGQHMICFAYMQLFTYSSDSFDQYITGTARYNPFREYLSKGRGVYKIVGRKGTIKYIGSSYHIHQRLKIHAQTGILVPGDTIMATLFHHKTRQRVVLAFEKQEIKKFNPLKNIHTGTPARAWQSEQVLKFRNFYVHNQNKLLPEYRQIIRDFLGGHTMPPHHDKIIKQFLRTMKAFK